MKFYYRLYFLTLTIFTLSVVTSCRLSKPFSCVWQSPLDYAYDSLTSFAGHTGSIDICDAIFENKDNGTLFQDVYRLTLNCDSTFTWKHISCTRRDTSFGNWTVANNIIYLTTSEEIKRKLAKQKFEDVFDEYIDLSNTSLLFKGSFVIWQRNATWTDTLYRH
jgi:hypothetical protein